MCTSVRSQTDIALRN
ncbi:hypothetical protein E2C01_059707 [Portunus trituberculatus]|uniref:Uncharacterized protein n=1 Tax=Portunus trituberculatus TaxID=210409 RepID=A0A5B7H6Y5_PORTR|nr:hypothetical protein [Portunus trituberculatus]